MANPPKILIPGAKSIPAGYVVGRSSPGKGDQQLVDMAALGQQLLATGNVAGPSGGVSLTAIDNNRVLGNTSGASAIPTAQALTQPAAGLTITGGASAFTFALANDLAALEGLSSTGLAVRTTTDTWAQRTITGTANRLTVTQGDGVAGNPTLDISSAYVGQATITTLGTIATGTWQATIIAGQYGGTGVANTGLTITLGGNLVTSGAFGTTLTVTATTNSTLPAGTHTLAGLDVAQTWSANQQFNSGNFLLKGATSGTITLNAAAIAGSNTITLPAGTTDFSATGATGAFVKQASAGAAFTVAVPTIGEIAGLGAGVATFLATPSSANLAAAVTDETGTAGKLVFDTSPVLVTPTLGDAKATSLSLNTAAAAVGLLDFGGTYTTANAQVVRINTTHNSSATGTQYLFNTIPTFNPSGASLSNLYTLYFNPRISGSATIDISNFYGFASTLQTNASYANTIAVGIAYQAFDAIINGTNPITAYTHYNGNAITNGDTATTGTITNRGLNLAGITAGAAGATLNNRTAQITVPSGTAPASGTVNNRGIYITGNGGAAPGGSGVVNNFALFSDSTAPFQIGGMLYLLGATASFPAAKRNATVWETRLADDSGYAPKASSEVRQYGGETGQYLNIKSLTELTTIAAAATTTTTIQIPADAIVIGVSVRVTTVIPTATTFTYGVTGTAARYGTGISTAANTTAKGMIDGPRYYAAAIGILITPNLTPANNTGRLRVTIHYLEMTPPTS